MIVKVKRLNKEAQMPFKKHKSDYCFDVYATSCEEVAPNVYKYGTGLSFEIDRSYDLLPEDFQCAITLRPRSSIWKTGMVLSNGIGTIDADYRGEICAVFYHIMPNLPRYMVGDRIGQIHLDITEGIDFVVVDELSDTERGDGGYGSTGK